MDASQIGKRAWRYAGVLQDTGLSCFEYVEGGLRARDDVPLRRIFGDENLLIRCRSRTDSDAG